MKKINWVDLLAQESSHVETPDSWVWWSNLCCISAASGNNYYLTTLKGDLIYRPNLYVILLGESGLGKGYPVNRAKLLVERSKSTRVIAGRSSIQAIVQELSRAKQIEGRPLIEDSRGLIINGELSTAIIADPDALAILTDLYDGHYNPEWTNLLKSDGAEKLKNPYITALFGSSPAHFYDSIPLVNIEGGFVGRNLIIYEEKRSKDVDLLDDGSSKDDDKFDKYLVPKYVPHLENISKKKGQLKVSDEGRILFNTWRRKWRNTQIYDKTGFLNRVPDHVLKVSMCLSLAEWDFDGEISIAHIEEAIQRVTMLVYANKKTADGRGSDPTAIISKTILDYLIAAHNNEMTRRQLLWKGYGSFDSIKMDAALEHLLEMGWIRKTRVGNGKEIDWVIHLSGEPLVNYKKYIESKKGK